MRLPSRDSAWIEIRPTGYQFGANPRAQVGTDWDANWLVVRGDVKTTEGVAWTFVDPCLTTWEAQELAAWLHGVVDGSVPSTADWAEETGLLHFTEPNLAFSLEQRTNGRARLRVHLSLEASPPWLHGSDRPDLFEYFLVVDLSTEDLAAAAEEWDNDCKPFPVR
jgi:hypothetical protein